MPTITNFGGNTRFHPAAVFEPRSEAEVLDVLRTHRGRRIRAVGRLHSWSAAPVCDDVMLDLRSLNGVTIHAGGETPWVEVGAGCQMKRLVRELGRRGWTLPTLGLIDEQTVAGATATGTHGSGRHSLSHYVRGVRLAGYDATGEPVVRDITGGDDLRAARCSLGSLGVVTAVQLPIRRQYRIEEHLRWYARLDAVLDREAEYPLQQFFLIPWRWDFLAQHRREAAGRPSRLTVAHRLNWALGMDVGVHLVLLALARRLPGFGTRLFYRHIIPRLVVPGWTVVDRSDRQLTMNHELFRHIEIEVFVTRSRLAAAVAYVVWLLRHLGGEIVEPPPSVRARLAGDWEALERLRGGYLHHYPICVRKVLPDDTLISMAAGDEPYYALSFISYVRPEHRSGFFAFAAALAGTMATLFDARPHWGKVCPLPPAELVRLYPGIKAFAAVRDRLDPTGVFGNEWTRSVLTATR